MSELMLDIKKSGFQVRRFHFLHLASFFMNGYSKKSMEWSGDEISKKKTAYVRTLNGSPLHKKSSNWLMYKN
jgi:hypothetical protein